MVALRERFYDEGRQGLPSLQQHNLFHPVPHTSCITGRIFLYISFLYSHLSTFLIQQFQFNFSFNFFSLPQAFSRFLDPPSPQHVLLSSLISCSQFLPFAPFHSLISFLVVCPHLAHSLIPPPRHSAAWL